MTSSDFTEKQVTAINKIIDSIDVHYEIKSECGDCKFMYNTDNTGYFPHIECHLTGNKLEYSRFDWAFKRNELCLNIKP
jgi:hypothetical protein